MKTIREQKQQLQEIENLIESMKIELHIYRTIAYRYFLKHGNDMNNGVVEVPYSIEHTIVNNEMQLVDLANTGLKSNYERIIEQYNNLN